jgi:hypothetical protein
LDEKCREQGNCALNLGMGFTVPILAFILLMWNIWWAANNASTTRVPTRPGLWGPSW